MELGRKKVLNVIGIYFISELTVKEKRYLRIVSLVANVRPTCAYKSGKIKQFSFDSHCYRCKLTDL